MHHKNLLLFIIISITLYPTLYWKRQTIIIVTTVNTLTVLAIQQTLLL